MVLRELLLLTDGRAAQAVTMENTDEPFIKSRLVVMITASTGTASRAAGITALDELLHGPELERKWI